jgi:hypothetical protein
MTFDEEKGRNGNCLPSGACSLTASFESRRNVGDLQMGNTPATATGRREWIPPFIRKVQA